MVKVPVYERTESLRPNYRQGIDVQASPGDFGAAIGQGMQQAAQGVSQLAAGMQAVRELDDTLRAKDADNAYADWARERMYGNGGFMTLEGRNAVDGRSAFEREAEEKRKEFGKGLTGGAAKVYQEASRARMNSLFQQSIVHTANERKSWFKQASSSRLEVFANDALANYGNSAMVDKQIAAGQMELRQQASMLGWDEATLKAREADFISGVRKNVTLRIAQDDPLLADKYMKDNASQLTGAHQYELRNSLETEVQNEQSKRVAEDALRGGRKVSELPGDMVGEVLSAGQSGGGPTRSKQFLSSRSAHKYRPMDTLGLDNNFADNLAALIQDAPAGIKEGLGLFSAFRTREEQANAYAKARPGMAAKPGGSQHEVGNAVDLSYNGQSLKNAPAEVVKWVHENAGKYGLYFPLMNSHRALYGLDPIADNRQENWHIEPLGTRGTDAVGTVAPRNNRVSPRALAPSFEDIEARLAQEPNEKVRDLARKRIYAQLEAQSKAVEQQEKAAKAELWKYVDQGMTPDQVPMEVRQLAGMAAVSSAWSYIDTAAKGRAVESDETLLYNMRRAAAMDPTSFSQLDLNDYRDRLSKEAIKELTGMQTTALTDQRKAREEGIQLTSAFSQASTQLEAVGLTTTGKDGGEREAAAKRIAMFQNTLANEMEAFRQMNNGKQPTQLDIQSMINRLLLPIVIKEEKSIWNPTKTPWTSTYDRDGFLFEAGSRADGTAADVNVKYEDIPIDLRRGISLDLERELGRKPSEEEVVQEYKKYRMGQ